MFKSGNHEFLPYFRKTRNNTTDYYCIYMEYILYSLEMFSGATTTYGDLVTKMTWGPRNRNYIVLGNKNLTVP